MERLSQETLGALNTLLADERASVFAEVALACGATEYLEREAFVTMGREDTEMCCALHEQLTRTPIEVTQRVGSAAVQAILEPERYDERLRAFAAYQRSLSERAKELAASELDSDTCSVLQRIAESHIWHALWAEQRAGEFAATRQWGLTLPVAIETGPEIAAPPPTEPEFALEQPADDHATGLNGASPSAPRSYRRGARAPSGEEDPDTQE
jgi:hypothetical protein